MARVTVVSSLRRRDACRRSDKPTVGERVLEELGWRGRLIRIWPTDWIRNPGHQIARVLLRLAVTFGVTPREDLITSTAREPGFGRTGKRISARIESVSQGLVQQGRLRNVGDERLGVTI